MVFASWLVVSQGAGCALVSARPDVTGAAGRIQQRLGVADVYDPAAEAEIAGKVEVLLADGLSVDEALQIGLLNNRDLQASFAEIGVARADVAQSKLMSNPTLSLGLQLPEGGGVADFTVGLGQQIADLWQIPLRTRIAEQQLEQTLLTVGDDAVRLAAAIRTNFYRATAAREALKYSEENLRLTQRTVGLSEAQANAGEVSAFDAALVNASVIDAQMDLIVARGELEQARVDLGQILGLSARYAELEARGDLLAANAARPADAALFDHALENRFDVRVSYLSAQRAEAALRLEMRRFLPDVQLGFAFERNERRGQPGRKILADAARESIAAGAPTVPAIQSRGERALADAQVIDAKLGPTIALALPLFDQNQAQIAKARARVLQSRKAYEAKCNVVAAEVERARLAHDRAAELLNYLRNEALPQATHTVEGAQQRYQAGEEGILTVIEAQDALVRRRRIYVSALRDFATTEAQLDAAVGGGLLKQQAAQAVSKN